MAEEFNEPTSLTVEQAVDSLLAQSAPEPEKVEEPDQAKVEDQEEVEAQTEAEEVVEDDQPEAEEAEDTSQEEAPDPEDDELFFDVDGEEVPLSQLREWRSNGLKNKDYTQKTQALAEQTREVEANRIAVNQELQALTTERQQLQEALTSLAIETEQEPDWTALAKQLPPQDFLQRQATWNDRQAKKAQARQAYQALQQQQQQQTATRELAALMQKKPEMADPANQQVVLGKMQTIGADYGFAPDEVAGITDHRMILVLDALSEAQGRLAEFEKAQAAVSKRVVKAEPRRKAQSPETKGEAKSKTLKAKQAKFKKSRSIDDAVDLLFDGLNS